MPDIRNNDRRRSSDGTLIGLIQGWPLKLQLAAVILGWFGPLAIISCFFMAIWAGWLTSPITENTGLIKQNLQETREVAKILNGALLAMSTRVRDNDSRYEQMIRLQLATCRNVAKTDDGRKECNDYWDTRKGPVFR